MSEVKLPRDPGIPFFPCREIDAEFFETAPVRYVRRTRVEISAERLFGVFEDPNSWPKWAMGIGEVEWTSPQPYGPGTTRTVRFWGGMSVYEDFFVFDSPREMAFRFYGISQNIWSAFGERYRVTELGPDACELEWTVAFEPAGILKTLGFLTRPAFALNFHVYMLLLRRYCRRLPPASETP